jgi:hypothetical protein
MVQKLARHRSFGKEKYLPIRQDFSYDFLSCLGTLIPETDVVFRKHVKVAALAVGGYPIEFIAQNAKYAKATVIRILNDFNRRGFYALMDGRRVYSAIELRVLLEQAATKAGTLTHTTETLPTQRLNNNRIQNTVRRVHPVPTNTISPGFLEVYRTQRKRVFSSSDEQLIQYLLKYYRSKAQSENEWITWMLLSMLAVLFIVAILSRFS